MAFRDVYGYQSVASTLIGVSYTITYDIPSENITAFGTAELRLGKTAGASDVGSQAITTTGSFSYNFTALSDPTFVSFYLSDTSVAGSQSTDYKVDNVSILAETFKVVQDGGLAQLIAGMADNHDVTRLFLETLTHIRDPYKTTILSDLEKEYGVPTDLNISEDERREKLAALKFAKAGTGTVDKMQTALDRAFPGKFTVYENEPPQDPGDIDGGSTGGRLIVNGNIYTFGIAWKIACGEALAQCGEPLAECGENDGVIKTINSYPIPTNGFYFHLIFFVGGQFQYLNLLSDGDMEAATAAAYTPGNSAILSKTTDVRTNSVGLRSLNITYNGVANPYAQQTAVTVTESYRVIGWARGDGTGYPRLSDGGFSPPLWDGTISTEWQSFDVIYTAQSTNPTFWSIISGAGSCDFDDILITKDEDVLRVNDWDMEDSGTSAWTAGNSATLTKETTDPFRGTQVLRIAYNGVNDPFARQDTITNGEKYRVTGWARSDGTSFPNFGQGVSLWVGTQSTDWQRIDVTFTGTASGFFYIRAIIGGAGYAEFDDLRVWKVYTSIDRVDIPIERKPDFERLILQVKPMHSWCMAFVGYELALNGDFSDSSEWVLGTDWAIGAGKATKSGGAAISAIAQTDRGVVVGKSYEVTFTLSNYTAGTVAPIVGSSGTGTARSANGIYQETIVAAGAVDQIGFIGNAAFGGSIDDVSFVELEI